MSPPTRTNSSSDSVDERTRDLLAQLSQLEREAREEADGARAAALLRRGAALALDELSDPARAEGLLLRAQAFQPGDPDVLRSLARVREQAGDLVGVAAVLEEEAGRTQSPAEAATRFLALARWWEERLGRRDRAVLFYGRAVRLAPDLAEARRRAVASAEALGRYAHAKKLLDGWREAGGDRAELATAYAALGALLADEPLEHGLALDATVEAMLLDRAIPGAAETLERLKGAARTWKDQAATLEHRASGERDRRDAARTWLRLAALHVAYDPDGAAMAREAFDRAWLAAPGHPRALDLLEKWHGERGDWPALREELARLASSTRDLAGAVAANLRLAQLATVRFGDTDTASEALARAIDLDPANDEAALHLFESYVDGGRDAEALSTLERHLAAAPRRAENAPLRLRGAELALAGGDPARARGMLEAALREDPGFLPAARALLPLLEGAEDWPRVVELIESLASAERDPAARASLLVRAAEVALEALRDPGEAVRILSWALVTEPARLAIRRQMEAAAARTGDFTELARAFRAGAAAATTDLRTRKALLRRVAEIEEHDLGHAEEAARVWRQLAVLDPDDRGAASAYEAALSRAGRHGDLIADLSSRLADATGEAHRDLAVKIARLRLEAGDAAGSAAAWREMLAEDGTDPEVLRGLATALRNDPSVAAADELCQVLARLSAQGAPDRTDLEAERAALLLEPLERPEDAASSWLALLEGGGLGLEHATHAVRALEDLLARGVDPVRIARALAPVRAASGDAARHVDMLEVIARDESAVAADRARMWLDVSAIRQDRLDDTRGALDAAVAAFLEAPAHPEARRRVEDLATRAKAFAELYAHLVSAADALSAQPAEERSLRIRAARLAEEELGSHEQAVTQLRRARALGPEDPEVLAALTRLALAGERWEEARDLLTEREGLSQPAVQRAALLTQLGDLLAESMHDPAAAAAAYRRAIEVVPRESSARLLARLARALEAAGDRDGLIAVLADLAEHPNVPPGLDLPVPPPPVDPLERLALARSRLGRDAQDEGAAAELERLATELDRPSDLAWGLERRLSAALFDPDLAFRLAELRRTRLGDPAGALRLLAELIAHQPDHLGARQALLELAIQPGRVGRDALVQVDDCFHDRADGETRVTVREDRLAVEQDPAERARLQGEIRTILEVDLADPARALDAARGAFAGSGREREEALADIPRLAGKAKRLDVLAEVWEAAASTANGVESNEFLRLAARTREGIDSGAGAIDAWQRLRKAAPGDPEALEALDRNLSRERRIEELAPVLGELAEARRGDPPRRQETLLRRAVLLEGTDDAHAAVDAFAAILEEFPQDGAALSGLARALSRPGSRSAAARLLEKTHRAAGDKVKLAELLEIQIEDMGHDERRAALPEIAALREASGQTAEAFDARVRQYADERRDPDAEPALRTELLRLAAAAGREDQLADILESSIAEGLPDAGAAAALVSLAALHRAREEWAPLATDLRRRAALVADLRLRRELWQEVAEIFADRLGDPEGARAAWAEASDLLDREAEEATSRTGGAVEGADQHVRAARLRRERLGDGRGAVASLRAALAAVPRHTGALSAVDELSRDPDVVAAHAPFFAGVLAGELAAAEASGSGGDSDSLRVKLAALRDERLQDTAGALALLDDVLARHPDHAEALAQVEAAMVRDPGGATPILERAYASTGRYEKLAALFAEELPRLGEAGGAMAMRLGALHEGPLDRTADAPAFYEQARRLDPSLAPRALAALERLYRKLERWSDLAAVLDSLAEVESRPEERTGLLFVLAQLCEDRLAAPGRAADAYGRVIDAIPGHPASVRALFRIAGGSESTDADLSGRLWRRLADADPGDRRPLDALRRIQGAQGDQAGLADTLRRLLPFDPGSERDLRLALAETLLAAGDRDAAAEEGRCAFASGAVSDAELTRLAALFSESGADDDRLRVAEARARRLAAEGALSAAGEAFRAASVDWAARGRTAEAAASLAEAFGCDPGSRSTFDALRAVHAAAGDWAAWARVTDLYVPRVEDAAGRAALLEELGDALETRVGDPAGAWMAWRRAFREAPSSERSLAALERLAPDHGDPAEMAAILDEAADAASGERQADLLLRVAVSRGVHSGDAVAGAEAVRRALLAAPGCLDAIEGAESSLLPQARACLLAWGAEAWKSRPGEAARVSACLEAAHRLAPADQEVARALEHAHREAGNWEALVLVLRARAGQEPDRAERARLLVELGEILAGRLDRAADAEAAFREALALGLEPRAAADLLLRVARMRTQDGGDPAAARADYERILELSPGHLPAIRALQDIRHAAGDRAGYTALLLAEARHTDDAPRAADALLEAARLSELAGQPREEAGKLYAEALQRVPGHLAATLALSDVQEARGDFAGVARLLDDATSRMGPDGDPRELLRQLCRLGRARENLGDVEGAIAAYQRAREMDGTSLPALKGLGALLARRGAWDEALPVLEAILAHHRDSLSPAEVAVTSGWVGQILERQGWSERAAENFEKALEADPEHVPSLRGMARTLQARGDWPRAAGLLERLLRMPEVQADRSGAAKLHLQLGEVLRDRVGDEELALHHFELALDADHRLLKAFAAVESTLAGKRKWRELAKALERMIERLPEGPDTEKARLALWKELGELQRKALGDLPAARRAYEQVVRIAPDDLEALQAFAEIAAAVPGQEAAAAQAYQAIVARQKDPSAAVSQLLAIQLARKDLDRAYAAADVLAHLLRTASPDELETLDRLRRLSREFATRSLDDVLWQRLLHERLRAGPVTGILSLLARDAAALFTQSPKDLGLNPARDEVDLATSGLVLANGIKYASRALGIEGVRLFRVAGSPMRLGFANTDPPALVAGEETYQDRPRKELWYVAARTVSFCRPELRLARLMPHDQLEAVFQAACSVGLPAFEGTSDPKAVQKLAGSIERVLGERGKLPVLARLAQEYGAVARSGDVRAHMDAVELTANRAGALLAGDLQVARRLVLEEKAQVSKLQDDAKVRDLARFCLSEDWAILREALGLSVAAR